MSSRASSLRMLWAAYAVELSVDEGFDVVRVEAEELHVVGNATAQAELVNEADLSD